MDNRINEIRRKISSLRAEMPEIEAAVRDLVNRDLDCSEPARRLMEMRTEVAAQIRRWKAVSGGEALPAEEGRPAQRPIGSRR